MEFQQDPITGPGSIGRLLPWPLASSTPFRAWESVSDTKLGKVKRGMVGACNVSAVLVGGGPADSQADSGFWENATSSNAGRQRGILHRRIRKTNVATTLADTREAVRVIGLFLPEDDLMLSL